jgi:2-methylcitrate dehydratase PrpD
MPKDTKSPDIARFIHDLAPGDIPAPAWTRAELCTLDLIGVGFGGSVTPMSRIARDHATAMFGGDGRVTMLFDGRATSPAGAAMAGGFTIDALDAHDGYNPTKGHIGCGVFPAALAFAQATGRDDGREFLTAITLGYELGARFAVALHGTVSDYHTSGAWVAPTCAALGARALGLDRDRTRHAMGIGEYHGPRSQMMRVIDWPTMVKDGSGWGAMAGVSAAYLAQSGFTGAPAITAEGDDVAEIWADLGQTWLIERQYFKPYPVCRWAQAPIEGVLSLVRRHKLTSARVDHVEVETFHEAVRLATPEPKTTEEAQYSTTWGCAVALVRGQVGVAEVTGDVLNDPEVLRISRGVKMREDDHCNRNFPAERFARVSLHLTDGGIVTSEIMSPRWTMEAPPTDAELRAKFHTLADPLVGAERAQAIEDAVAALATGGSVAHLASLVCHPVGG